MIAKAVANHTTAAFFRVVASEFVQKYLGEGPRMVRDVFRLARENAPSIIFIDEVDAVASNRFLLLLFTLQQSDMTLKLVQIARCSVF
jgi:26S proteasome regulatory subunit T3